MGGDLDLGQDLDVERFRMGDDAEATSALE